jgi:hypothetical protein
MSDVQHNIDAILHRPMSEHVFLITRLIPLINACDHVTTPFFVLLARQIKVCSLQIAITLNDLLSIQMKLQNGISINKHDFKSLRKNLKKCVSSIGCVIKNVGPVSKLRIQESFAAYTKGLSLSTSKKHIKKLKHTDMPAFIAHYLLILRAFTLVLEFILCGVATFK